MQKLARTLSPHRFIQTSFVEDGTQSTVKMLSPDWYGLTQHAFEQASRLAVDLMIFNDPGWFQSGESWIKPEPSLRRVTWNEIPAQGGALILPRMKICGKWNRLPACIFSC
jgi:alpha-L-rhamnosidase